MTLGSAAAASGNSKLFGDLPERRVPEAPGRGMPRLRQPERHQLGWQVATIDDLVARDHPVRAVSAFVQGLDLRAARCGEGVGGGGAGAAGARADNGAVAVGDGRRDRRRAAARPVVQAASCLSLAVRRDVDELPHAVGFPGGAYCRELLAKAQETFVPTGRDNVLASAHELIVDEAPWVWIVHDLKPRAMSAKVKGFRPAQSWFQDFTGVYMD
jgi:hypothetical protein